jgi:hypothetical protein
LAEPRLGDEATLVRSSLNSAGTGSVGEAAGAGASAGTSAGATAGAAPDPASDTASDTASGAAGWVAPAVGGSTRPTSAIVVPAIVTPRRNQR